MFQKKHGPDSQNVRPSGLAFIRVWAGRTCQAAGLLLIGLDFIRRFPELMPYQTFLFGIGLFLIGWILLNFTVKGKHG